MIASIVSCFVGKGVRARLELFELVRPCWLPLEEGGESDGGCPLDFGGGVGKV